jgi:hypothetical protein
LAFIFAFSPFAGKPLSKERNLFSGVGSKSSWIFIYSNPDHWTPGVGLHRDWIFREVTVSFGEQIRGDVGNAMPRSSNTAKAKNSPKRKIAIASFHCTRDPSSTMPLYPIIRRARNPRGPHNLIDRSNLPRDNRWSGGKPVGSFDPYGAYKYLHPNAKIATTQNPQDGKYALQQAKLADTGGSIIDPPALEQWRKQESAKTGVANTNQTQAAPQPRVPDLPSEEELLLRNPYRKRTWNFTIQCRLAKYKPDLAKRLELLAASSE